MSPRVNDDEREAWVLNDEGLYLWWKSEDPDEKHLRRFVKRNRAEINAVIREATRGGYEDPGTNRGASEPR